MKITQELRAFAIEQAGRRCECTGAGCRHHLRDARCKRGLRGEDWKVYWRSETGGATRENIEAWCLECFGNNFEVPTETVALLALDIVGYPALLEENYRKATTLRSVLRDVANRCAEEYRGRIVFDRLDDDLLVEFGKTADALKAAYSSRDAFHATSSRLDLPEAKLCGALHCGTVTRWRNGMLAGDAVEVATSLMAFAGEGSLVVTPPAADPVRGRGDLEPVDLTHFDKPLPVDSMWALKL